MITVKAALIRAFVCTALYFSAVAFLLTRPQDQWDWPVLLAFVVAIPSCWIGLDAWYKLWQDRNR